MTIVFSLPFDKIRYFRASVASPSTIDSIVTAASNASVGKRTWSAFWTIVSASILSAAGVALGADTEDNTAHAPMTQIGINSRILTRFVGKLENKPLNS